jgi:anaerobic selenocysteine-containing dehydrogenase
MCPTNPKAVSNPAARVYKGDLGAVRQEGGVPVRGTTYRLTEHFHFWTKHSHSNAVCSRSLRRDRRGPGQGEGHQAGDKVKVRSNRGDIKAVRW